MEGVEGHEGEPRLRASPPRERVEVLRAIRWKRNALAIVPVIPLATKVGALAMTDKFVLQRLHNGGGIYCFSRDVAQA